MLEEIYEAIGISFSSNFAEKLRSFFIEGSFTLQDFSLRISLAHPADHRDSRVH